MRIRKKEFSKKRKTVLKNNPNCYIIYYYCEERSTALEDSALGILTGHIDSIKKQREKNEEKLLGHLSELSALLCEDAGEDEIFFKDETFISKYKALTGSEISSDTAPFNRNAIKSEELLLTSAERAHICLILCELFGIRGIKDASTFFDVIPQGESCTVSYVRTVASDGAYLTFAPKLKNARSVYADDFLQVCENVYYGKTDYCILPVANSLDGRLAGIRNLALKYALKTVRICRIKNADDTVTVFALMKKELEIPEGDNVYFEFSLKGGASISEITAAALICGVAPTSVSYSEEAEGSLDMTVKADEDGICGFFCYLHLQHPNFIPLGIFSEK